MKGISLQAVLKPREGEILFRSPSGFNYVLQPKNSTKYIGNDKGKDFGSLDGISSLEIAEKVKLFSY